MELKTLKVEHNELKQLCNTITAESEEKTSMLNFAHNEIERLRKDQS